ncbi:MAG TPA: DUF3667 domain-containing protein [Hyphomonadaceae bacterium]|nr:DUF3667 domain-containing protein [Hyphomonadaceae bacterium]
MASDFNAGAAITAGLTATALEGGVKARGKGGPSGSCQNCGQQLTGNYCARCGQPAHIHDSLKQMVGDVVRDLFHFDARAWRTLPMLLVRPGTLTRQYVHGHRAKFVSPLTMFLLGVFAMFFALSTLGDDNLGVVGKDGHIDIGASGLAAVEARLEAAKERVNELKADSADQAKIDAAQKRSDAIATELERLRTAASNAKTGDHELMDEVSKGAANGDIKIQTGWPMLDGKLAQALQNPQLTLYKIQDAASKYAFLLAPISLPFVWLLFFWKRGLTLFDHTVYILYSLSFVAVLAVLATLAGQWGVLGGWMIPAVLIGGIVHEFFHMKGAYNLGWFSAVWRLPFLVLFAGISLLLFVLAVIFLGIVG